MIELFDEQQSSDVIRGKHSRTFAAADRAWNLISSLIKSGQSIKSDAHFRTRWVVLALFTRQNRFFRAIVLLLERGLVPEAQICVRSMIETHLHLDFLVSSKDPAHTAQEYLVWEYANNLKLTAYLHQDVKEEHAIVIAEVEKAFAKDKARLGPDGWRRFLKNGPPMLSLESLARKQSFGEWYDLIYRRTSGPVHAYNIQTYAQPMAPDGRKLRMSIGPIDDELDITLEAGMALLIEAAMRVDTVQNLGKFDELKALDSELKAILEGAHDAG